MDMATIFLGIERDRDGKQIDPEKRADSLRRLRAEAVSRFGGYTLMHGEGAEQDGQPEAMVRVDVLARCAEDVSDFALLAGRLFNQRGVLVKFGNHAYIEEIWYSPNDPSHSPGIMTVPAMNWPLNQAHPRLAGYRDANPGRAVDLGGREAMPRTCHDALPGDASR